MQCQEGIGAKDFVMTTAAANKRDNNPAATFKQDVGRFNAVEGTGSHTVAPPPRRASAVVVFSFACIERRSYRWSTSVFK